jgi:hypothetical protein
VFELFLELQVNALLVKLLIEHDAVAMHFRVLQYSIR